MNKLFTLSLRLGMTLVMLMGSLVPAVFGRGSLPVGYRSTSRNPTPRPVANRTSIRKSPKPKVTSSQDLPKVVAGQTATLLADGRWLLVGGDGESMSTASIVDSQTGEVDKLARQPLHPRTGHTATVLPNGTVLMLGGVGARGQYVEPVEVFDPETQRFQAVVVRGLSARANHTATLLTSGNLMVAGGTDHTGKLSTRVELWDSQKNSTKALRSRLASGRRNHIAALQADGTVILSGGIDENGDNRTDGEICDPESQNLVSIPTTSKRADIAPSLEFSAPENGEMEVDENSLITLRFSRPLSVKTINRQNVVLQGPKGEVATRVVPAEAGMLMFITPLAPLAANSDYHFTITGASDGNGQPLPFVAVSFKTKQCGPSPSGEKLCGSAPQLTDFDTWIPDANNLNGAWQSGRPDAKARSLPALQAASGETALSGQVLTLSGNPLANVTLQVGDRSIATDQTGRFLLPTPPPGSQVLTIQGHTASQPGKTYGTFDVLVDVVAGKTTVLPYTIWLPVLDEHNKARLSIPTARETAVTTPRVPGMEVRVPSGAVLRMPSGKHHMHRTMKRELESIAITPIPADRPPFPLPPGVDDGLLFTLQLHGARVEGLNGEKRPGLRIIFPNYQQLPAGTRVDFWNYDAEAGAGWYMYGKGTVTADRRQVIPDPGVELQSMHCISLMNKGDTPGEGPAPGDCAEAGDPVNLGTGLFVYQEVDLVLSDVLPISLARTYRQKDSIVRSFGKGTTNPYDIYVAGNTANYGQIVMPDGSLIRFDKIPNTGFYEHTATPTRFYKATMRQITGVGPNGAWEVKLTDGSIYQFGIKVLWGDIFGPHSSITGLSAVQDRYGNRLTITRDSSFRMTRVTSPNGRWIDFSYSDTSKRIAQATDNIGRTLSYIYDANGRLWKVTDAKGGITEYTYDSSDRMLTIKDPRSIVFLTNEYDANGRVIRQTQADAGVYQFAYALDGSGKVTQTDVTDPRGFIRRTTFNSSGYKLTDTFAFGRPEQQTYTFERQVGSNFVLHVIDPLNRKTVTTYDAQGNATSQTRLADTPGAVTTSITYEPAYNQLASVTDPLGHTVTYSYNVRGLLTGITNALGHKDTLKYNAAAEMTSIADALGNTTWFNYDQGVLNEITDPLGRTTRRETDAAGRLISVTNPVGGTVRHEYDNLNQRTQTTNQLQGIEAFTYDPNGNLLSVTDARNSVTSYIYDNMDRVTTRRDPLLRDVPYQYDLNGNLTQVTDRKGQVINLSYDALNRLTHVIYADASTTTYTYDAGDRLTQVVDSLSGTITYAYDDLDRMTSETTPQGSISYTYDAAGRRTSMTVAGQPTVNYSYDHENRLTQITRGSATVTVGYDTAGRRTSLTLPNGLITQYAYNQSSQLTSLTYKQGATTLGDLTFEYDANGRRAKIGGSFARSVSPQALSLASYNAANQQVSFGGQTLAYDLNGNLVSDGVNSYTRDARNRLVAMSGPNLDASFQYDALGRRISKAINGVTTSFLYDGVNVVQEQSAQLGNANMLNGDIDEVLMRTDSAGTWNHLMDGLGSTLAVTDASGVIQSEYAYGAFGQTAISGDNRNSAQYTGRENDGTGLYYYRARSYSPSLQRFISEDPIRFAGGDVNLYAYVSNDPINYTDPSGLERAMKKIDEMDDPTVGGAINLGRKVANSSGVKAAMRAPQTSGPSSAILVGSTRAQSIQQAAHLSASSGAAFHTGTAPSPSLQLLRSAPPGASSSIVSVGDGLLRVGPELYNTLKIVDCRNQKINDALRHLGQIP